MIGRILYRESVHGVINYVFGKTKIRVLGYQNTYSKTDTTQEQFTRILHHLGGRHESQKRYVHISLNLPHGEKLNDSDFYELSKNYMENMGYGEQPFVVVRHFDTQHQHVHIVSTTVKENGNLIDLSHDFRRNVATQKYLEQRFGLSPSPETKSSRELPLYRLPEIKKDDTNGVKFYIQDILNSTLQKHKVRSFKELAQLVAPYHIVVKPTKNRSGRIGVSYGIAIDNGYRSRFIDGYTVHPRLSGPKLQAIFNRQSQSKSLPMHRKRLEKQLMTTFQLFKSIYPEDLPHILKSYQKIDAKVRYNDEGKPLDFTILDKSGYVFNSQEISSLLGFEANSVLNDKGKGVKTELDTRSNQMALEVRKLIKNAFYTAYLNGYKDSLLSEFVRNKRLNELLPIICSSERFVFLNTYLQRNPTFLASLIRSEFEQTQRAIYVSESKKEVEVLHQKAFLIQKILGKGLFDVTSDKAIVFELLQSLGVKYVRGHIAYLNSNRHQSPLALPNFMLPETTNSYVSTGFISQNEKVLNALVNNVPFKEAGINGSVFFLPIIFPSLYGSMSDKHRQTFEELSLSAYQETGEKLHIPFEKSAKDYIRLFNAKGIYFLRKENHLFLHSIYSKFPVGVPLLPKTQKYLLATKGLDTILKDQRTILDKTTSQKQGHLKNLWVSYLIEKQLYEKAAFMIANDGVRPNLSQEILKFHMENGLREKILVANNQKVNAKHARLLRRSVYAFSSLLGKSSYREEEVFDGFRDELTDYEKYKSNFI
ncbi:relaxase/mobilization nuclease domain-containing protein [Ulvibacterium marinum]|uniref:MobA/VirD2-like nuclease domain-containing protein n=1 Tax=Ulvibacterium marinum TaxID=2419782 RepID=A0A3B0CGJ3_9FLAO|nr:relaxase/mobilization nuclease domain-containing protein [Ulvibacterium marinum]RKN83479.1 hypothetical protein D7Z94_06585 [Ulvibacterium marinum]